MSNEGKPKRFTLDPNQTSFTLRDIDNAQPPPPKPRSVTLNHPRLAPPGMSGIRSAQLPTAAAAPRPESKRAIVIGDHDQARSAFKPLVRKSPDKSRVR